MMSANFSANPPKNRMNWRTYVCLVTLAGSFILSSCGQQKETRNEFDRLVDRETLYRDLAGLEKGLADGALNGLGTVDEINTNAVIRPPFAVTPAQFEISRNRRALAFEQLALLPAPEATAPDFGAFWELHQAYRAATETGIFGHGKIGLIYSRPYAADHLSNPMVALQDTLDGKNGRIRPGTDAAFLAGFTSTHRRLDLALASGHVPPKDSIKIMLDQVLQSPLSDAAARNAYIEAQTAKQKDAVENVFDPGTQILLTDKMLAKVALYRETLEEIAGADIPEDQLNKGADEFYDALVRQTTGNAFTPLTCHAAAVREGQAFEASLLDLFDKAEIGPDGTGTPLNSKMSERFIAWQNRTPLFEPARNEDDADLAVPVPTQTPTPGPEPEDARLVSDEFNVFRDALDRLKPDWTILFHRSFAPPEYTETGYTPPRYLRRGPIPAKPLQLSAFNLRKEDGEFPVSNTDLTTWPASQMVIDALIEGMPGKMLAHEAKENREDLPELSRKLPNLAFDLGWPHFAVSLLNQREAFSDAPRLTAAHLYRLLQIATEAEIETGLALNKMSPDQAQDLLRRRFDASDETIAEILLRMKVEPSLSCAQLAGYKKLETLSEKARGVLGIKFNLREFNEVILTKGSRPMTLVERDIDSWIARKVSATQDKTLPD